MTFANFRGIPHRWLKFVRFDTILGFMNLSVTRRNPVKGDEAGDSERCG